MNKIEKQVKELREYAGNRSGELSDIVNSAADTIEELFKKLKSGVINSDLSVDLVDRETVYRIIEDHNKKDPLSKTNCIDWYTYLLQDIELIPSMYIPNKDEIDYIYKELGLEEDKNLTKRAQEIKGYILTGYLKGLESNKDNKAVQRVDNLCEFCETHWKDGYVYDVNCWDGGYDFTRVKTNYCPVCGKELTNDE